MLSQSTNTFRLMKTYLLPSQFTATLTPQD
uniref:Uncharacterized protein n=1 Tax=Rhizophora mucronata TaxID=61149 RepID=A0A2P2NN64_RHIMU